MKLSRRIKIDKAAIESSNLCHLFSHDDLGTIGNTVWDGYTRDKASRSKWEKRMEAAMDFAMQVQKGKNFPWPGSANVIFPLITVAALQFSARAYPSIIKGTEVVRYRIASPEPTELQLQRARRIGRHMSWQILEEDLFWEEQHDRLLINLAIIGCNFVKTYFCSVRGHNVSELVMARDLVLDYFATSVEGAARKTHTLPMYRNDIFERVMSGTFRDVRDEAWFNTPPAVSPQIPTSDQRKGVMESQPDETSAYRILEQHRNFDLDGDGYEEPYIVTIEETSRAVLRLVLRVDEESQVTYNSRKEIVSIKPTEYFTKYSFIPSPDGGIYDLGFGTFLGPINEAVSSAINQLLDAGTLQNSLGGFLGRGVKIRGGVYTMAPWEWKRVDSTGDDLRKNIFPFPERQPMAATFQLIGLLIDYANRIAGTTDPVVGVNPGQNTPAETSRTMTEMGMQVYSAIFKRVWRSFREEFRKLFVLNGRFLPQELPFGSGPDSIRQEDYKDSSDQIAPVADPRISSASMQIAQATLVKQSSMVTAGYDKDEVERSYLRSIGVENINEIYPGMQKTGPLPNPKIQAEQLKLQGRGLDIKAKQMKWANELLQERPRVQAQIDLLRAQAVALIAKIGADKAAQQIAAFEAAIKAWETHQNVMNERIKTLLSDSGEQDGQATDGGGVHSVEGAAPNPGDSGSSSPMGGGDQGAMGGGGAAGGGGSPDSGG